MLYIGAMLQPLEGAQGSLFSTPQGLRMDQVKIILLNLGLQGWLFSLDPLVTLLPTCPLAWELHLSIQVQ